MFDIKSQRHAIECSKKGHCFDETFYMDKKSERRLQMLITKVTKEFAEEQRQMKRETIKQSRVAFAFPDFESSVINDPI